MKLLWLPLWGLVAGILLLLTARFAWPLGTAWLAALLLALSLLLNGGSWLRDVMWLSRGRAALTAGCLYLLLHYACLLALLRLGLPQIVLPAAAVLGRWIYVWGVYDFAALAPANLRRGLSRTDFIRASASALIVLGVCSFFSPALILALLSAACAAFLFYRARLRYLGALDEASYGAAAAWSELIFYLAYFVFYVNLF